VKILLQKIVANPRLEARWLNTLSLLEHMGARKISKTVANTHPSLDVLKHHSDETRHAYILKNLSKNLWKENLDYLCREEGVAYFQNLDHQISEWVSKLTQKENDFQNYLFVTCAIERRAMALYPLYKSVTTHPKVREELKNIILEEADHRQDIETQVAKTLAKIGVDDFSVCQKMEEVLFEKFTSSLRSFVLKNQ